MAVDSAPAFPPVDSATWLAGSVTVFVSGFAAISTAAG